MSQVNINPRYLHYPNKDAVEAILDSVQKIDETPTAGSGYPVSSQGVKTALDQLQEKLLDVEEGADPTSLLDSAL